MFSNDEQNAVIFQLAGVGLVTMAAIFFLAADPFRAIVIGQFDAVMLFSIFLSYFVAVLSQETYVFLHTSVFLVTYVSIMIIAQHTNDDELIACIQLSIVAVLAIVLVVFGGTLFSALMPGALKRWELRQAPFDMHPNLAGFVYGGFIVMIANSRFSLWGQDKLFRISVVVLCLAIMIVASARGGILAVALTLLVYGAVRVITQSASLIRLLFAGFAALIIVVVFSDRILPYATEMLDLDSKRRGLESGGTGRFELWQQGIDYIAGRTWQIFIGSGLRSATISNMGFPTENSYINLTVESGIFLTAVILFSFVSLIARSYRRQLAGDHLYQLVFYSLIFAMFQSVFNRYLIAIGNPFSICVLLIASKASAGLKIDQLRFCRVRQFTLSRTYSRRNLRSSSGA
ncbi:O-antigen ligase family protein [Bradyrhizobium sp. AC87j1]|uniref:O-antigen ligase family protein n=1 Tax=Bradyrhizobium sp. AC87j1 TaxID=2055894 RepID=UPI001374DADD|nr:O-antigen ligase family protein [Bradyrhizobium sp. AC87j1]